MEFVPLKKQQKYLHGYVKDISGIKSEGPLSAEYVRRTYDNAYQFNQGMEETAQMVEKQMETSSPEARKLLVRDAKRYRKAGQKLLEKTEPDVADYAERNAGFYHEQAKTDMEAELSKRKAA